MEDVMDKSTPFYGLFSPDFGCTVTILYDEFAPFIVLIQSKKHGNDVHWDQLRWRTPGRSGGRTGR